MIDKQMAGETELLPRAHEPVQRVPGSSKPGNVPIPRRIDEDIDQERQKVLRVIINFVVGFWPVVRLCRLGQWSPDNVANDLHVKAARRAGEVNLLNVIAGTSPAVGLLGYGGHFDAMHKFIGIVLDAIVPMCRRHLSGVVAMVGKDMLEQVSGLAVLEAEPFRQV
ncbi:MAG TPA: hypothetical protein VMU69_19980 [Bradyrhizobium sp.]|nr:hypothetical protein [Bradyrhizobium sp.]